MIDNLDLAEEYIYKQDIAYEKAIIGKACCDCDNYEPCPWNPEYGLCISEHLKKKRCSDCGKPVYHVELSWDWILGDNLISEIGCESARILCD